MTTTTEQLQNKMTDIIFRCETCDVAIIRNSKEHDECWTKNGDDWICGHCPHIDDDDEDDEDEQQNKMAYVGQCGFNRSPVKPYNMLTIISNEPLPTELPGTPFPIKLLFKISGDWAGVVAPYRLLKSVSYDLPSLDILEPFKLNTDEDE
jgi:hypothetical protein